MASTGLAHNHDEILYFVMVDRFYDAHDNLADVAFGKRGRFWGGDLAGLTEKIPDLANLGITTLWITPLYKQISQQIPDSAGEDTGEYEGEYGYHGYWPDFDLDNPCQIDPHFGTQADLRRLLDTAHQFQIKVILDVVVNHTGYHSQLSQNPQWMRSTETDSCLDGEAAERAGIVLDDKNTCLFGLPDFRTEVPEVAAGVKQFALCWIEQYPIDGFRFDTAKHVEPQIFIDVTHQAKEIYQKKWGKNPADFLTIGEWWGSSPLDAPESAALSLSRQGAWDAVFDFEWSGLLQGFVSGKLRGEAFLHHLQTRHDAMRAINAQNIKNPQNAISFVHFLDNHDVDGFLYTLKNTISNNISNNINNTVNNTQEHPEKPFWDCLWDRSWDRYALASILHLSVAGIAQITWGNEVGALGGTWPHNRAISIFRALPDDAQSAPRNMPRSFPEQTQAVWRRMIHLRKNYPALSSPILVPIFAKTDVDTQKSSDSPSSSLSSSPSSLPSSTVVFLKVPEDPQGIPVLLAIQRGPKSGKIDLNIDEINAAINAAYTNTAHTHGKSSTLPLHFSGAHTLLLQNEAHWYVEKNAGMQKLSLDLAADSAILLGISAYDSQ